MRKELYETICKKLMATGQIKHVDLWNQNVEFIEQEEVWNRPAVFVEFTPIRWNALVPGKEYRAEPIIKLHIVTDWNGSAAEGSPLKEESLEVFDLCETVDEALCNIDGETFLEFDLVGSDTNHNHEDILENIEIFKCVAIRSL